MARTRVVNRSGGDISLPAPYSGIIASGGGAILEGTPDEVIANMGGLEAIGHGLLFETAGDAEPVTAQAVSAASRVDGTDDTIVVVGERLQLGPRYALSATAHQALTTPGAIDVAHRTTRLTTSGVGADAATLADGTAIGQRKSIILAAITTGGDTVVVTPTNFADGSTLTFAVLHDGAELEWNGAAWELVSLSGAVVA